MSGAGPAPGAAEAPALLALRSALAANRPLPAPPNPDFRRAAVLVPLWPRNGELELLFTSRSPELKTHAGQVSFPGGSIDPGESPREAALREAREEVGLQPAHVEVLGQLDDTPTYAGGFVITPIVGLVHPAAFTAAGHYPWNPSAAEVAALHELPLRDFIGADNLRVEQAEQGGVRFELYWYTVQGTVVWGATARIVHQLATLAAAGAGPAAGPAAGPGAGRAAFDGGDS